MLDRPDGPRFAVLHTPAAGMETVGSIVYVPPFAEEMNKARRAAAVASRAYAAMGWAVLQMDLYGCGDSAGEFEEASWARWIEDVRFAVETTHERTGHAPMLWAVRAGSLLLSEVLRTLATPRHVLLWQPALSGQAVLTQFLRMRVAAEALASSEQRSTTAQLRERLLRGERIDVAGYRLPPGVALPLEASEMSLGPDTCKSALWIELAMGDDDALSPGARSRLDRLRAAGVPVQARAVRGDPFWQTQETTDAPSMVDVSCQYLAQCVGRR